MSENEKTLDELPTAEYEGTVHPNDLHTDGDNPNEMTDEQFGLLCDRMRQNGWLGGPVVTDTEGLIADGEHRWRAAQEIGLGEVPVKQYDIDDGKRRLWRQELNKIHGEHDSKRDALEYDQLLSEGYSQQVNELVDAAGEDLDELLKEIRVDNSRPADYEYNPEHNVYFEDCVEGMAERLDDDSVDCVITDPPYGIDYSGGQSDYGQDKFDRIEADEDIEGAIKLYRDVAAEIKRVLKPDGHLYVFTRWDVYPEFHQVTKQLFNVRNCLVWNKDNHGLGDLEGQYAPKHEFAIFASGEDGRPLQNGRPTDVLEFSRKTTGDYDHPTQKPVDMIEHLLTNSTREGETVLDPFMGSGTTAVAAIQNDRDYVGFELDEDNYRSVIERRISEAQRQMDSDVNQEARADD